jgi:hypothetical protein
MACSCLGASLDGANGYISVDGWTWGGTFSIEVFLSEGSFASPLVSIFDFGDLGYVNNVAILLQGNMDREVIADCKSKVCLLLELL